VITCLGDKKVSCKNTSIGGIKMNILLCCSAGMSTSLLVTKMEKAAQEQGIDCKIWAVGNSEVDRHMEEADVLLLGPQVRFMLSKMKKVGAEKGIPVDAIDSRYYGLCNGEEVLKQAIQMING
jgi:PTS system cellobiose-specific IIB component